MAKSKRACVGHPPVAHTALSVPGFYPLSYSQQKTCSSSKIVKIGNIEACAIAVARNIDPVCGFGCGRQAALCPGAVRLR
jgi:hypothetical protein